MSFLPHPLQFAHVFTYDASAAHYATVGVLNSQIPGTAAGDKLSTWNSMAQRWRLAYASVTIYQDAPALADQGTIVGCQAPVEARSLTFVMPIGTAPYAQPAIACYEPSDDPSDMYSNSQNMPNAYFNRAKEGLYMPMKLTRTHQQWHSMKDNRRFYYNNSFTAYGATLINTSTVTGMFPFPDFQCAAADPTASPVTIEGHLMPDLTNGVVGRISSVNNALTTSFSIYFRYGFEMVVQPGSILTPNQRLPPPDDEVAINTYFKIARELKDAYPSDYNDLGKIWDAISSAAGHVIPGISSIPVVGPAAGAIIGGVKGLGDMIRAKVKQKQEQRLANAAKGTSPTASAAEVEAVKKRINVQRKR
jgi:hypothetical protein